MRLFLFAVAFSFVLEAHALQSLPFLNGIIKPVATASPTPTPTPSIVTYATPVPPPTPSNSGYGTVYDNYSSETYKPLEYKKAPDDQVCPFVRDLKSVTKYPASELETAAKNCTPEAGRIAIKIYSSCKPTSKENAELLTDLEAAAICLYTGSYYPYFHGALKSKEPTFMKSIIARMDDAFNKLPNYEGWVYHGSRSKPENYQVRKRVRYTNFISTSQSHYVAASFASEMIILIYLKTGKNVQPFSAFGSSEQEIMIPRGTKFDIVPLDPSAAGASSSAGYGYKEIKVQLVEVKD